MKHRTGNRAAPYNQPLARWANLTANWWKMAAIAPFLPVISVRK
jgi:hypothetical protein